MHNRRLSVVTLSMTVTWIGLIGSGRAPQPQICTANLESNLPFSKPPP